MILFSFSVVQLILIWAQFQFTAAYEFCFSFNFSPQIILVIIPVSVT